MLSRGKFLLPLAVVIASCAGETKPETDCQGAKCDIPDGPDEEMCELRRRDAFNENQQAYRPEALRWSCADVEGVTEEDRGQEYCEYFAITQLPTHEEPAILGMNVGPDHTHGTTEPSLELTFDDIQALEADESAVVGQCVFSSWNSDIETAVPACEGKTGCPEVAGVPLTADTFRMKFEVNSAEAAQVLVEECLVWPEGGDPDNTDDPLHDDFYRGCMMNADINDTAFRKSDTIVCSSSMRLAECECWPAAGSDDFPVLISPFSRRGFPLGTWSGAEELPGGCRYVELGDDSKTLVTCDLSASDVLTYAFDLKGHCRQKYADNVVVHVPLPPASEIECAPSSSESAYAGTCSDTPWLLDPER